MGPDLGAQSIDYLDLSFRYQKVLGIYQIQGTLLEPAVPIVWNAGEEGVYDFSSLERNGNPLFDTLDDKTKREVKQNGRLDFYADNITVLGAMALVYDHVVPRQTGAPVRKGRKSVSPK